MANPDFPLQTNMLMDGNTIFNTFVKVVIGKTPLYYILTCTFKACYKITFRSAWYTGFAHKVSHYHKRSNVESTMWMIKSKFSEHIRSKTDMACVNELLCKVLCHNICVVIQFMYELGIEPAFWAKADNVQKTLCR